MAATGSIIFRHTPCALVLDPDHARMPAGAGYGRRDVQQRLYDHAGRTVADLRRAGEDGVGEDAVGEDDGVRYATGTAPTLPAARSPYGSCLRLSRSPFSWRAPTGPSARPRTSFESRASFGPIGSLGPRLSFGYVTSVDSPGMPRARRGTSLGTRQSPQVAPIAAADPVVDGQ
ncbi:hypothetical protein ACFY8K_28470 [Streptomyces misionensis]|uniref:hypothetical protein n=1 Tax=Streptomyces misionensis TaxID=67331 RepID=UPI0036A7D89B